MCVRIWLAARGALERGGVLEQRGNDGVSEIRCKGQHRGCQKFRVRGSIRSRRQPSRKIDHELVERTVPEARHHGLWPWPPARLVAWATILGPSIALVVERMLSRHPRPELAYRPVLGVI